MAILIILIVLAVLVGLYFLNTQRELVNLDEMANNALSQIGVQLTSRWDAVTALVKLTKDYARHEHDTLVEAIEKRRMTNPTTAQQINDQFSATSEILGRLIAVSEQYGILLVGKSIQLTAHALQGIDHLQGTTVLCTLEGHVFTKMCQTLLVRQFIATSHRQVISTPHHLRCRRQMDDPQSVVKLTGIILYHLLGKDTNYLAFPKRKAIYLLRTGILTALGRWFFSVYFATFFLPFWM